MIELRTPAEIDEMRAAGRFVAETLATLRDETKVGTNLLSIDRHAHDLIRKAGAESCYIDYAPSFGNGPRADAADASRYTSSISTCALFACASQPISSSASRVATTPLGL